MAITSSESLLLQGCLSLQVLGEDGNIIRTASESKAKETYGQNNCLKGYRAASEKRDCEWMALSIIHLKVLCNNVMLPRKSYKMYLQISPPV